MMRRATALPTLAATLLLAASAAHAQFPGLTLPPSGANQKASVSQWIGPVEVSLTYSSPDVTAPNGEDRTGKIWGQLVPYGMANLGFGTCGDQCPWRAGSNENTVFKVSHDVLIEGKPLPAGSYGLHMLPGEQEWTLIFSKNSTAWGSFFYDAADDALRVTVKPKPHEYTHWLTYEFTDRQPAQTTAALRWEKLEIPWTVSVPKIEEVYVATLEQELQNSPGFNHLAWVNAATYCLLNNTHPEQALEWAQAAVSAPFVGQENFATLSTLGIALAANGKTDEGATTLIKAVDHPTADVNQVHQLGRQLIAASRKDLALKVFEANAKRHTGAWPTEVGLARGYSAVGEYQKALDHAKVALTQAPDDVNRTSLQTMIERLGEGKDVN